MINFKVENNKIIVKILFDLIYDNSKIFYGGQYHNERELDLNTARDRIYSKVSTA